MTHAEITGLDCPDQADPVTIAADWVTLTLTATEQTIEWVCTCGDVHHRAANPGHVRLLTAPGLGVHIAYDIAELADPQRHHPTRSARHWTALHVGPDRPPRKARQRGLLDPAHPDHAAWWTRELAIGSEGIRGW